MNFKLTLFAALFLFFFSFHNAGGSTISADASLTGFDLLWETANNKKSEIENEILVVLQDFLGEVVYSKVIVTGNNENFYTAIDPYKNVSAGTYMVIGSTDNDLYFRKMVIQ